MKRCRLHLALLVLAGLLASGCRRASTPPETIRFWHTFTAEETGVVNARLALFQAAHPEIAVQSTAIPFGAAQSRIKEAWSKGDAPDLFRIEAGWAPEFARLGMLAPADGPDGWLNPQDRADLLPAGASLFTMDGRLVAAPHVVDCLALLYNRRLLAAGGIPAPPADYEDLVGFSRKLTDAHAGRFGFFLRGDGYWYLPFLWGAGGDLVDPKGTVALDSPAAVQGLKDYVALWQDGITPPGADWAQDYRHMMRMFGEGQVAMILNGPWATPELLASPAFAAHPEDLGVAPIPAQRKGNGLDVRVSPIGAHGYAIAAKSVHRQAAAELAHWLLSPESEAAFTARANLLPARRAAWVLPEVAGNRVVRDFRRVLDDSGRLRPLDPELTYVIGTLSSAVQEVAEGQISAQDALATVAGQWRSRQKEVAAGSPATSPAARATP